MKGKKIIRTISILLAFIIISSNSYVNVFAKSNNKTINYNEAEENDPIVINKFVAQKKEPQQLGTEIPLSVEATGGYGKLQYSFYSRLEGEGGYRLIRNYSDSSTVTWKPKSNGRYYISVRIKDENNSVKLATLNYVVCDKIKINSLKCIKRASGTEVDLSADVSGGSSKYTYQFLYKDKSNTVKIIKDYSDSNTITWIPDSYGQYLVAVKVKDSYGFISMKSILYNYIDESNQIKINALNADKLSPQKLGETIKFTTDAIGGEGTLLYQYLLKDSSGNTSIIRDYNADNTFEWKSNVLGEVEIIVNVKDETSNCINTNVKYTISNIIKDDTRLILPDSIYLLKDEELDIFKSSLISNESKVDSIKTALLNTKNFIPKYTYFQEDLTLKENQLGDTFRIVMRKKTGDTHTYYKDINKITVNPDNITNTTPTILHIGDSLTHLDLAKYNNCILKQNNINANFVGTMYNGGEMKGEGRSGWMYSNYTGRNNRYMNNNMPITPANTAEDINSCTKNPFLRLATEEDKLLHPNWCFRNTGSLCEKSYSEDSDKSGDFYIFDFKYYLEKFNITNPDLVVIALLGNDFTLDWYEKSCSESLDLIYSQIRSVLPKTDIGVVPGVSLSFIRNSTNVDKCYNWIEKCMKQVKKYNDDKLNVIPSWMFTNRDFTNRTIDSDYSDDNNSKISSLIDGVHYNTEGRILYAKSVANWCLYALEKNVE